MRVETAQYAEGVIPPYYDSLIAKLITHGVDRAEAMAKMERALRQFIVQGVETSISLHQEIFQSEAFRAGRVRYWLHGALPGRPRRGRKTASVGRRRSLRQRIDGEAGSLGGSMLFQIEREKGTGAEFDGCGYVQ